MLTLLSMLGGGALRLIPFLVDIFKQRQDAEHEYRMTQLQLQIDQARATQQIDLAHAQAEIAANAGEMAAWADAIKGEAGKTGIGWVDALSSSVRPILTYYWCIGLYGAAKLCWLLDAFASKAPLKDYPAVLISDFDQTVIAGMLSFWFVDRSIRKMTGR